MLKFFLLNQILHETFVGIFHVAGIYLQDLKLPYKLAEFSVFFKKLIFKHGFSIRESLAWSTRVYIAAVYELELDHN